MISLIQSIVDIITSLVGFVINTISGFINILVHIPTYTDFLISTISLLPTMIIPFCVASISIYVIFLIIGRG